MTKRSMPQAKQCERPAGFQCDISPQALERWSLNLRAAAVNADNIVSILDPIGSDFWTGEGITAKRVAGALRAIGADNDVVVHINSPGGDVFEGMAIYNLLREHRGQVKVKVLGLAASAASIIAMAGDEIEIARAGFIMIHNTWVAMVGNRNDLRDAADMLEPFDAAMAQIYIARTGIDAKAVAKKMDAETWINGSAAVDEGWADALLPADAVVESKSAAAAARTAPYLADMAWAKAGMSRSERRSLMQELKASTLRAAGTGMPGATEDDTPRAVVAGELLNVVQSFSLSR